VTASSGVQAPSPRLTLYVTTFGAAPRSAATTQ
jgi:hypothetical protein